MFTREFPFDGNNTYFILDSIKAGDVSYQAIPDQEVVHFLKMIFKKNPEERATIQQLKTVPYFRQTDFTTIFTLESPLLKIVRRQSEQYFFRGEALIRILG